MSVTKEFALDEIGQIAITVQDLEAAVAFYRDTLGMRLLFQASGMAFFDCGGVRLMMTVAESEEFDHPAGIIYYRVPDIDAAFEALRDRGVRFKREPQMTADMGDHELWMAFFQDMDENTLALMSENPKAS